MFPGLITFARAHAAEDQFCPEASGSPGLPGKGSNWAVRGGFSINYDLTYNNLNINAKPAYFQQTEDVEPDRPVAEFPG